MSAFLLPGVLILLQLIAAFFALRLMRVTGERRWRVIAIGMTLMALRQGAALLGLPSIGATGVELAASLCLALGITWLASPLRRLKDAEAQLHESCKTHEAEIAVRQQIERALQEQEEQFRNLAEGSIEGIIIHRDFKPLFVNQAWASMHGYTPEEILAMDNTFDFIAPEDRERILSYKEARLRGETVPNRHEYRAVRRAYSPYKVASFFFRGPIRLETNRPETRLGLALNPPPLV